MAGCLFLSSPKPSLGAVRKVGGMALPLHGDPARGRGGPEHPELAREAHLRVAGRCLVGVSAAVLRAEGHPPFKGSQRDQSWCLEGNGG